MPALRSVVHNSIFLVLLCSLCAVSGCGPEKPSKIQPGTAQPSGQSEQQRVVPPADPPVETEATPPANVAATSTIAPPSAVILFQPRFTWEKGDPSYNGTGFLVRSPDKKLVAVTSYHFLADAESPLLKAEWLSITEEKPVITATKSWVGKGVSKLLNQLNWRYDFVLFPTDDTVDESAILELDPRKEIPLEERIWFPNKDPKQPHGYKLVEGRVINWLPGIVVVELDAVIELESQSGTPVISQVTGQVIGILSTAGEDGGGTTLALAPVTVMMTELAKPSREATLKDVIGVK